MGSWLPSMSMSRYLILLSLLLEAATPSSASTALDFAQLMKLEKEKMLAEKARGTAGSTLKFPRPAQLERIAPLPTPAPSTVWYIPDFITRDEEVNIMAGLDAEGGGWNDLGKRRLKHFGGVPDPGGGAMVAEPLPCFAAEVCKAIAECEAWEGDEAPNHLLCNSYAATGGIGKHLDGPMFRPRAAILSMGSQATIRFWTAEGEEVCKVILMPRSLLVFSNEAYTEMSHSIEPEEFDEIQGAANSAYLSCEGGRMVLPRGERCSLTARTVGQVIDVDDGYILTGAAEEERRRRRVQFEKGIDERRNL